VRSLALLLVTLILLEGAALADEGSCFSSHVREAIRLNEARAVRYREISGGRSRAVSDRLLFTEHLTLIPAAFLEARASYFRRAGIPVLCADFVTMALTPPFEAYTAGAPALAQYRRPPTSSWKSELRFALNRGGFLTVHQTAVRLLRELEEPVQFNCMVRHVLESLARGAWLAPQYEARAKALGLRRSPAPVSRSALGLQIEALGYAAGLDFLAAPLQAEGIPILCQDVPPLGLTPHL
jgi:hypothetical protein